jgi:hypothetical protein
VVYFTIEIEAYWRREEYDLYLLRLFKEENRSLLGYGKHSVL